MKTLLVTGASGFLGHTLCRVAAETGQWRVHGVHNRNAVRVGGVAAERTDLTDNSSCEELFARVRPDAVVHAAAVSQPNACEDDAAYSEKVNVGASRRIAKLCAANGASCVFVSTDLVFDGEHAPYAEADPAGPVNRYGEQKAAAEKEMCAVFGGVTVCRMPLMFGDPSPASHSFIQPFGEKLKRGEPLNLFTDEIRTPVSAVRASRGLLLALGFPGEVFHLGGRQRLSRFEMGLMLAEVLGADRGLLRPALRADVKMAARRPRDVSLDSSKAYAMGFEPGDTMGELVHVGM